MLTLVCFDSCSSVVFLAMDVFAEENLELTTFYWPDATRQSAEDALSGQELGKEKTTEASKQMWRVLFGLFVRIIFCFLATFSSIVVDIVKSLSKYLLLSDCYIF